ncbi:MAG: FAD-binding protein [Lachnospiraceae bacterium]|nr:FAD-binding protein [Lachnospiraceae bacterium]
MKNISIIRLNTLVVGSGAAGYSAALRLKQLGVEDVAIATEGVKVGTSRNTGSDKQTYYKLGMAGDTADSVAAMAKDLFAGGCVDGDNALVEAALSARCFLNLCELGVPFPTNLYGEYVGYKTDHDPCARATSVGPLTSKEMTEKLEAEVIRRGVKIYDHMLVISVIKDGVRAAGVLALDTTAAANADRTASMSAGQAKFCLFNCKNIIFATGGPGGIYADSVYPMCHNGSNGVLFEAGVKGQNLTQWQYGLASVNPRWNVSGTYMQVLPRFVSVDKDGKEYDFLEEYFEDESDSLSMVFLKGYQWPFDSRKVLKGSSVIDLLVYREKVMRGRRVFLDFTHNPGKKKELDYTKLSQEAQEYLQKAGACFGTPIERLAHMNQPAIELYASKGVDLYKEKLEIALCAQHNNGGTKVDLWWQTDVEGLFVCGEAAGTHGIYRPGGSALNAGQVGALRAAQYISAKGKGAPMKDEDFLILAKPVVEEHSRFARKVLGNPCNASPLLEKARKRMSARGGALRESEQIEQAILENEEDLKVLANDCGARGSSGLKQAYRLRDVLICQKMYLYAMKSHIEHFGKTCGSALYYDKNGILRDGLEEVFRFSLDGGEINGTVQEMTYGETCTACYRPVRPLPEGGGFFENVWRKFRERWEG